MNANTEGQEHITKRARHIRRTQFVFGLVNAWSDFFTYLGEAMKYGLGGKGN